MARLINRDTTAAINTITMMVFMVIDYIKIINDFSTETVL